MSFELIKLISILAMAIFMVGGATHNIGMYRFGLLVFIVSLVTLLADNYGFIGLAIGISLFAVGVPVVFTIIVNLLTKCLWNNVRKQFQNEPSMSPSGQLSIREVYHFLWHLF